MIYFESAVHRTNYIYVSTINRTSVIIYWRYKPTVDTLESHTISIYRSYGQTQTPTKVASVSAANTHYIDEVPNIYDSYSHIYYQLQINDGALTDKVTFDNKPMPRTLHRRKNVDLHLRTSGLPCLVYQKSVDGAFCPVCFDTLQRKATDPNCPVCLGTGRTGGWYSPIYTLFYIVPPTESIQPDDVPKQIQESQALLGYFPLVNPKDLIFDLTVGEHWRITSVHPIKDAYDTISQELGVTKVAHRDGEYLLPLPSEKLTPVLTPLKHRKYLIDLTKLQETING